MRWENRVFAVLLIILLLALGIRYWRYTIVTAKVQAYLAPAGQFILSPTAAI
jgi:hypothetical protein